MVRNTKMIKYALGITHAVLPLYYNSRLIQGRFTDPPSNI